jgi:phosphoribosylformylglycinamidine (FGAM) synthase-like amidotransferase family enzyme
MSSKEVKVCVLRIEGTNCEEETSLAFKSVGASPEKVHLKQLIHSCPEEMKRDLDRYDILALPGGFSAGDYVRAGAIFAARIRSALAKGKVVMFPSAHMEGKLMFRSEEEQGRLAKLEEDGQVVFRYVDPEGRYAGYPWSPNGSISSIAGVCNPAGNVLGLMPHPERVFHRFTHPDWTRSGLDPSGEGDGRMIFQSAVEHASKLKN